MCSCLKQTRCEKSMQEEGRGPARRRASYQNPPATCTECQMSCAATRTKLNEKDNKYRKRGRLCENISSLQKIHQILFYLLGKMREKHNARSSYLQLRRSVSVPYKIGFLASDLIGLLLVCAGGAGGALACTPVAFAGGGGGRGAGIRCAGVRGSMSRPKRMDCTSSRNTLL